MYIDSKFKKSLIKYEVCFIEINLSSIQSFLNVHNRSQIKSYRRTSSQSQNSLVSTPNGEIFFMS